MDSIMDGPPGDVGYLGSTAQDVLNEIRRMLAHVKAGGQWQPSFVDNFDGAGPRFAAIAIWYAASYADIAGHDCDDVTLTALEYELRDVVTDSP